MNEQRRQLLLRVLDGYPPNMYFLFHLNNFKYADQICHWLIDAKLTGKNFCDWVKTEHNGSILDAGAEVIRRINKDIMKRKIIYGKDYVG